MNRRQFLKGVIAGGAAPFLFNGCATGFFANRKVNIGVVGFGRIGQRVGAIAKAMGMNILGYDLYPNDTGRAIGEYVSLDELLARADVISIHASLNKDNYHMINAETIAQLFQKINRELQVTIVMVTHSDEMARVAQKVYNLCSGRLGN